MVPLEGRLGAEFFDRRDRGTFQIHRRSAHANRTPYCLVNLLQRRAGETHLLNLSWGFNQNGHEFLVEVGDPQPSFGAHCPAMSSPAHAYATASSGSLQ